MDVVAEEITEVSTPSAVAKSSSTAKDKGRVDPSSAALPGCSRRAPTNSTVAGQEAAPVQPKRRGRPPKAGKLSFFLIFFYLKDLCSCF